jgi:outer membrane protein assembly factor BamD
MLRVKLSVVYSVLLALTFGLLGACSTTSEDKTTGLSPDKLYGEARDLMDSGQWDKAIPYLEKLESRAAGTPLAQQAQLDKAYAQFKAGDKAQANATLDRFMRLHPASPALDYALYLKGLSNFNENLGIFGAYTGQDMAERDQKAAKESFESFKELSSRFPRSTYTPDALLRMRYTVQMLAKNEVYVAKYYFKRGAYVAALNRAQTAVADYRDVPAVEEALYLIYKSYDALGMTQLSQDAKRVLEASYPNSEFLSLGGKQDAQSWLDFNKLNPSKMDWSFPNFNWFKSN